LDGNRNREETRPVDEQRVPKSDERAEKRPETEQPIDLSALGPAADTEGQLPDTVHAEQDLQDAGAGAGAAVEMEGGGPDRGQDPRAESPESESIGASDEGAGTEADADERQESQAEQEEEDERKWYVVHCYSGYENKVQHNLEQRIDTMGMKDRIFDIVVPTEEEMEVKDGKRRTVERRVFPGYILVQMIMDEDSWYVVRNTPGVTGFVGMGNEPTPLRPEEVSQIIKRMEAEAPRIKVTYKLGQKVRIIDGPFNDFIGTVDDIDMDRAKVRVMVSFFGRETPVELDFLQVEKA
jgi:transcriptional antiterminator NusG